MSERLGKREQMRIRQSSQQINRYLLVPIVVTSRALAKNEELCTSRRAFYKGNPNESPEPSAP